MSWIILATITPLMLVIYHTLAKLLPKDAPLFLVNAAASLVSFLIMFLIHLTVSSNKSIYLNSQNLIIAILLGVFVTFGNFFVIKAYSLGASQSLFSAIMYPLLIIYATLIGIFIWHEKINVWQLFGILLSVVGIILVFYFKESSHLIR